MALNVTVFFNRSKVDEQISELLKLATAAKAANPNAGASYLRKAYRKIRRTNIDYGIQTFLRLPMYLQAAGRGREALDELDRLFRDGCPNRIPRGESPRLMDQAAVLDKKRLVLQRQRKFAEAVPAGVLSWVLDTRGSMASPYDELHDRAERLREPEFWKPKLAKLLKPAKIPHNVEVGVMALVAHWMDKLPAADDDEYVRRLESLLLG